MLWAMDYGLGNSFDQTRIICAELEYKTAYGIHKDGGLSYRLVGTYLNIHQESLNLNPAD